MVDLKQSKRGGSDMKRQLKFKFENDKYVITEDDSIIFAIDGKTLKFVSLDFYNGIYKGKSAAIEFIKDIDNDMLKKGDYIFDWLKEIINSIQAELNEPEPENGKVAYTKSVPLFEFPACAGDGFYCSEVSEAEEQIGSPFENADYAVRISGKSMQPTIMDGAIVFVNATETLANGDIGIFVVNGEVMCKRYCREGDRIWLQPDNSSEYKSVELNEYISCRVQGKVLL